MNHLVAQLAGIHRPVSFIAVGVLPVATSIGYLKLTPRLLAMHDRMEWRRGSISTINRKASVKTITP